MIDFPVFFALVKSRVIPPYPRTSAFAERASKRVAVMNRRRFTVLFFDLCMLTYFMFLDALAVNRQELRMNCSEVICTFERGEITSV